MKTTTADERLITSLQKRTGINSYSDLVRLALRNLAEHEGVKVA